jgi:hypothetical protein
VLRVSRAARLGILASAVSLGFAAVALAATPVKNGVYQDGSQGVIVGVHGTNSIHAFNVDCHGKTWVARRFIPINSRGAFSYTGPDFRVKGGHKTGTTGTMTASGRFKTRQLIVGRFAAGGCSRSYSATFSYSLRQ